MVDQQFAHPTFRQSIAAENRQRHQAVFKGMGPELERREQHGGFRKSESSAYKRLNMDETKIAALTSSPARSGAGATV